MDRYLTRLGCRADTDCEGVPLKRGIDRETFRHLKPSSYWRDKNSVFHHYDESSGGFLRRMVDVDEKSFRIVGCYAQDMNSVYTDRGEKVLDVDRSSFYTTESAGCFAKDRDGYFFHGDRLDSIDQLDGQERAFIKQLGKM